MSPWIITVIALSVALIVAMATLRAQQRKLSALPLDVWAVVNTERNAIDEQATARLREATALADGIRSYHQQLEAVLTAERNDVDMRARVVERRSQDAGIALDAVSALVTEARALVDGLVARTSGRETGDPRERPTMEAKRRPSPAVAPPGSAAPMSPEPAQIAAGLGTRPHAPPRKTLLGIRPPALAAAEGGDRPSEDELTCVVDRPPAARPDTAKTSMPSVTAPSRKASAS